MKMPIKDFMKGTESEYSTWDKVQQTSVDNPIVLCGMTKGKYIPVLENKT